ncbi:uncharacterized protein LOC144360966 [Saccoglossus kowalevskii]
MEANENDPMFVMYATVGAFGALFLLLVIVVVCKGRFCPSEPQECQPPTQHCRYGDLPPSYSNCVRTGLITSTGSYTARVCGGANTALPNYSSVVAGRRISGATPMQRHESIPEETSDTSSYIVFTCDEEERTRENNSERGDNRNVESALRENMESGTDEVATTDLANTNRQNIHNGQNHDRNDTMSLDSLEHNDSGINAEYNIENEALSGNVRMNTMLARESISIDATGNI